MEVNWYRAASDEQLDETVVMHRPVELSLFRETYVDNGFFDIGRIDNGLYDISFEDNGRLIFSVGVPEKFRHVEAVFRVEGHETACALKQQIEKKLGFDSWAGEIGFLEAFPWRRPLKFVIEVKVVGYKSVAPPPAVELRTKRKRWK